MQISKLAERTGVPATTLWFYEIAGLLPAERTPAGYRRYGEDAVQRLAFIGAAKHLGLSLEEIAELLGVWQSGACKEVKADLRPRIAARIAEAERSGAELAAFTAALHRALEHLDALPDRSGRCDPQCAILTPDDAVPVQPTAPRADGAGAERWRTAPVACSLSGEGIAERAGQVAALAAAEQQCCPFLDFRLHLGGQDQAHTVEDRHAFGPVLRLEVRAPAEAADVLAELFTPAA
ncbi:MerR family transcriptional regulator [Streptomyces sp. CdTB01]|uniref:MerR family transcriptional regulator n=1 Tax=Streptomyces sp. CdTB01 TaxID=1725411 RepID=UPI00073ADDA4|nr:MerR family transcriptional regulator [Streptomyces sp. CdTB01]ALV39382.1 MerR family transcriptional regulator [Streptomyces sp. CdTB01]